MLENRIFGIILAGPSLLPNELPGKAVLTENLVE